MGVEIREDYGDPRIRETEEDGLSFRLTQRYTLARVDGWTLLDGIRHEVLAADRAEGKDYHYAIQSHGDFTLYIEVGTSKLFQRFYHWDGAHLDTPDEATFMARLQQRFPVNFGDVRAATARAMETTESDDIKRYWSVCRRGLIGMDQEHPEFEPALHYVMDYLDRFLKREAMAQLEGTRSQQQWARKVRLLAIQRLGLLHDDHTDMRARIDCKFARLSARTLKESGTWIGASDAIQRQPTHDTVGWLLSGW